MNFCRMPENLVVSGTGWPTNEMPWAITDLVPGLTEQQLFEAVKWGMDLWAAKCGIKPYYVDRARDARVLVMSRKIDGPFGVLAECEIPHPGVKQVRLWFDTGEQWETDFSFPAKRLMIQVVGAHELGHGAIGVGHAQDRANLMYYQYQESQRALGQWDIAEAVKRYGLPVLPPPFNPPMPPVVPAPPIPQPPRSNPVNWLDTVERVLRVAQGVALLTETKADDQIIAGLLDLIRVVRSGAVSPSAVVAALDEAKRKVSGAA